MTDGRSLAGPGSTGVLNLWCDLSFVLENCLSGNMECEIHLAFRVKLHTFTNSLANNVDQVR